MKIATWNVNSLRVRLSQVTDWLAQTQPNILALQEIKLCDEQFPVGALTEAGYAAICAGQKTYNGVALLSKLPAQDIVKGMPNFPDPQQRVLAASFGALRVINVYVPNGEVVGSEKYSYKLRWLAALADYARSELQAHEQVVMLGDFNIAPAACDVHDPIAWEGRVLYSAPEREALQVLLSLGLHDAFRLFDQPAQQYTWWDYRQAALRRNLGLRIDHILLSAALRERCTACIIDSAPRRLERPSDHTPVMVTLAL